MKNFELARLFDLMGDVLEIKGDNPFRIRACPPRTSAIPLKMFDSVLA